MVFRPRLTGPVALTRKAVREQIADIPAGQLLLVAISGGADSLALAAATSFEARKLSLKVTGVIIDHGLQAGSDKIALTAKRRAEALGLDPVVIEKVSVKKTGDGLEAEARESRYKGIEKVRKRLGASWVLLGHNLDDQAETVLLGLARGSGLKSIAGMSKKDSERKFLRPLLDVTRNEIRQACKDQGISYWDDPHNKNDRFLRVRVRKLSAQLEKTLGPGFSSALARTADIARESEEAISLLATELVEKSKTSARGKKTYFDLAPLSDAPSALRRKALHQICLTAGARSVSRKQILQVEELITSWKGQKSSVLSGITVERVANQLVVTSR
jgi:tRNA(Ile)-lysidine synthetase-like protein